MACFVYSQTRICASVNSGFNRIGLYVDAGADLDYKRSQFHLGARYYGPDYFFETDAVGLSISYQYVFSQNNWFFGPGLSGAVFFKQKKVFSETSLAEILVRHTVGYEFKSRFSIYTSLGLGTVINTYTNNLGESSNLSYINYEFSVGFKYYLRSFTDR